MAAPRILVVDDLPIVRKNLSLLLRLEGFTVLEAADGDEGLHKALTKHPDLIITDISLPKRSGLALLETLRQTPETATTPVILLSAHSDRETIRRGMEKGADDYITKPFKNYEIVRAVKRLLERRQKIQQQTEAKLEQVRDIVFYTLPHEFRTAINGIKGYAKLMAAAQEASESNLLCEDIRQMGSEILEASQRLERLMENLLIYAQLRATEHSEELRETLRAAVTYQTRDIVIETAKALAAQYHRTADLRLSLQHDAVIAVGYQHWQKIVYEIIDNAFKFSAAGTAIEITDAVHNGTYELLIRDYGRGMRPDQWKQVGAFVQFGRKQHEQQGLGLGLAIALLLIDLYNAQLEFDAPPDGGTLMKIIVPLSSQHAEFTQLPS